MILISRKRALLGLPPLDENGDDEWKEVEGVDAVNSSAQPTLKSEAKALAKDAAEGKEADDSTSLENENIKPTPGVMNFDIAGAPKDGKGHKMRMKLAQRLASRSQNKNESARQQALRAEEKIARAERRRQEILSNRTRQARETTQQMYRLMDAQRLVTAQQEPSNLND